MAQLLLYLSEVTGFLQEMGSECMPCAMYGQLLRQPCPSDSSFPHLLQTPRGRWPSLAHKQRPFFPAGPFQIFPKVLNK